MRAHRAGHRLRSGSHVDDGNAVTGRGALHGAHYVLNGDKLWCTNVTDPEEALLAVLARTPEKV